MNRREFLKTTAALTVLGTLSKWSGNDLEAAEPTTAKSGTPDLVVMRDGTPMEMFDRGIKELGGMEKFVKKGQKVTIKPNIAWNKAPELAANTNPDLVAHVIRACYRAGASKVYVFDTTCHSWKDTYRTSGIAAAAKAAGAEVIGGDTARDSAYVEKYYSETKVPKGKHLKKMMMHNWVRDCDVFINMPILKVHGSAKLTCCMKNLMGIVTKEYHKYFHGHSLENCIAECASVRPPDLNIVDAYRVLVTRGPVGVDSSDVKQIGYQMIGKDMVALDTAGAKILNVPLWKVRYLPIAEQLGLGTRDLKKLNIKRIKCKA